MRTASSSPVRSVYLLRRRQAGSEHQVPDSVSFTKGYIRHVAEARASSSCNCTVHVQMKDDHGAGGSGEGEPAWRWLLRKSLSSPRDHVSCYSMGLAQKHNNTMMRQLAGPSLRRLPVSIFGNRSLKCLRQRIYFLSAFGLLGLGCAMTDDNNSHDVNQVESTERSQFVWSVGHSST
jgi:hypothetical protein